MKPIPAALKNKLQNRFKSSSTDSEPKLRLIATQNSRKMLISEPIHEDIAPDFGDIAVRQMAGEDDLSLAYSICIDEDGIAYVRRRRFPALMDFKWEPVFEYGPADDVAIEFDGTWKPSAKYEYYYLETEEFPYIFAVNDGVLTVQKWRDVSTRVVLAEDVNGEISVCKGWKNLLTEEEDQGLIIGYIRDGVVFYRALAWSTLTESLNWEIEQEVTELGDNNNTLSVIRTNDFRIGFCVEQSGVIKMALTSRCYPGMSFPPESVSVFEQAAILYVPVKKKQGFIEPNHIDTHFGHSFFLMNSIDEDYQNSIIACSRSFDDNMICIGATVTMEYPLKSELPEYFTSMCTISTNRVLITDAVCEEGSNVIRFSFNWKSGQSPNILPEPFTITLPMCVDATFESTNGQVWYNEAMTASFDTAATLWFGYINDSLNATESSVLEYLPVMYHYTRLSESISVSQDAVFEYIPAGDIPV